MRILKVNNNGCLVRENRDKVRELYFSFVRHNIQFKTMKTTDTYVEFLVECNEKKLREIHKSIKE